MDDLPPSGPDDTPALAIDGAIATITLRRPAQRNSLRDADLLALLAHFARLDADGAVRVLVLAADTSGQPRPVFSAGYDLASLAAAPAPQGGAAAGGPALFERVADALEALRPLTVCALGGSVYGGATDLLLACDLAVARAGCEFLMPAAAIGLHYYPGGLRRYVSRLGLAGAKRAFLTAAPIAVERLAGGELFEAIVAAEHFDAAVQSLAARAAALAPAAAQDLKRSLNEIAAGRADEALLRAREAASIASADFAEGRAAAAARRRPRFGGR